MNADTLEPLSIDGKVVEVTTEYKKEVFCITVSASMLAIGGKDGIVDIYDLATRAKKKYWKASKGSVSGILITDDESQLVSTSTDNSLKIFDINEPKTVRA